jgi:hypothetical protein
VGKLKLALDVDGVLAGFTPAFLRRAKKMGLGGRFPAHHTLIREWTFGEKDAFVAVWDTVKGDPYFWLAEIQPLEDAFVDFPVAAYCTARPVGSNITAEWLRMHGFPEAPVLTVGVTDNKADILLANGIEVLIDDRVQNIQQVRAVGIQGVLMRRPHNVDMMIHPDIPDINYLSEVNKRVLGVRDGR